MNILQACRDPKLFAPHMPPDWWDTPWPALLAAIEGLELDDGMAEPYHHHTGRSMLPAGPFEECYLPIGRRGQKTFHSALIVTYKTLFRNHTPHLGPGERAVGMLIAPDRKQGRVAMRFIEGLVDGTPLLAKMVERRTLESIEFSNRTSIEVHTASFRSTRGYAVCVAVLDELAFMRSEDAAEPDREIVNALRPGMALIPGSLLLGISSPYARRGVLWSAYERHYGNNDSDVLIWRGTSREMNPRVPQRLIDRAMAEDPQAAAAEWLAEFRTDVESFITREAVDAVTVNGRLELPRIDGPHYVAFVDPSGGSQDSYTLAIAHRDGDVAVLDVVRERRPPFSPDAVAAEYAELLKSYGIYSARSDRYAGQFAAESFAKHGITLRQDAKPKTAIYGGLLPMVNSGAVQLLDHQRLRAQLLALERRVSRGGAESIDHPPRGRDDVINAAAGALVQCGAKRKPTLCMPIVSANPLHKLRHGGGLPTGTERIARAEGRGTSPIPLLGGKRR